MIDQTLLETPWDGSVPATGKLREAGPLYALGEDGAPRPMTGKDGAKLIWPAGSGVWIAGALDEGMEPLSGLFDGYLTGDSAWLRVWLEPAQTYGYLPVGAVEFDPGLYLPDAYVTGG